MTVRPRSDIAARLRQQITGAFRNCLLVVLIFQGCLCDWRGFSSRTPLVYVPSVVVSNLIQAVIDTKTQAVAGATSVLWPRYIGRNLSNHSRMRIKLLLIDVQIIGAVAGGLFR